MRRRALSPCWLSIFVLVMLSYSSAARGAEPDRERAQAHFEAGKKLRRENKLEQAIEQFKSSIEFEPSSVGARLNLGDCYVALGRLEDALVRYREAELYAGQVKDARVDEARKAIAQVEAKLVRVVLGEEDATLPDVSLRVDGGSLGSRPWPPLMLTPTTSHTIEATTPDGRRWSTTVAGAAGETIRKSIVFPPLPLVDKPVPRPREEPPPRSTNTSSLKTIGLVSSGVGGALALTGAVAGVLAMSWKSDLASAVEQNGACSGGYPNGRCDPSLRSELGPIEDRAFAGATVSTIGLVAGGVLLTAGLMLYLLK